MTTTASETTPQIRRDVLRARLSELSGGIRLLKNEVGDLTDADEADPSSAGRLVRLRAHLAAASTERQRLATEYLSIEMAELAERFPLGDRVLVGEDQVEAMVFLAAFADHDPDRAVRWLNSHSQGYEALLGMVAARNYFGKLAFEVTSVELTPIETQIRTYARLANHLGVDRLLRVAERRLVQLRRDLADTERSAERYAKGRRVTPGVVRQNSRRLETLPRTMRRHENVLALLHGH